MKKYINYKKDKNINVKEISIANILNTLKDFVVFIPTSYLDDNNFYYTKRSNISKLDILDTDGLHISMKKNEIILNILLEYKKNLMNFIGFLTNYDSLAKIKEMSDIWIMYKLLKQ